MLNVPTLPLMSKARKEIVCSPESTPARFNEYLSWPLSAIPSSGKKGSRGAVKLHQPS